MGSGDPTKEWLPEKWIWLARELRSQGFDVVATGTPGVETELAENVATAAGINNLAGRLGWAELVTLITRAAAVGTVTYRRRRPSRCLLRNSDRGAD